MRVRLRHETRYRYPRPAKLGPHVVRLHPAEHARARLLTYDLGISPGCEVRWQQDPAGNRIARATFAAHVEAEELAVVVDLSLEIRPVNPFDFFVEDWARDVPIAYPPALARELSPYLSEARGAGAASGARTRELLTAIPERGYITDWLVALNRTVAERVRYVIRDEAGIQTSEETLDKASGSCRDSARLLVDLLRARGLAARFVSGYLVQLEDEGDVPGERRGVSRDVVDLHAWAEVFVPGAGWVGLDGTSGLLCGEGHVPLASTADPLLAAPIEGTASEPGALEVTMEIARLGREPSPRRPYTDLQWKALRACGDRVDASLATSGIALTMGGEPTWISREHPAEPEWNLAALGPTKWDLGVKLVREIATRLATPGALTMQRMGKLYPGESLPRWVLHLIWRTDGQPIWHDARRLVMPSATVPSATVPSATVPSAKMPSAARGTGLGPRDAERLASAIARRLGITATAPAAAYEDPWQHIAAEQNLPVDVDPLRAGLDDPEQRRTLARVLGRGLGTPLGYVLPLRRAAGRWVSARWELRREALFAVPGDSPLGLRLPLDRIQGETPFEPIRDPSAVEEKTFALRQSPLERPSDVDEKEEAEREEEESREGAPRTALCTEVRDGVMHVFLPPVKRADDFLELVMVVEDASVEIGVPVSLEGYPPPPDHRLQHCLVTPDPGVLEVNVPVTERFADYATMMDTLAEAARHAGLTTIKLQLDGREVGTGGGHHLTLGGPTPLDSPFLRRPDLLASLLRYVQNHPSLSYLFTGLFVGPTSQAPRLDEARHDALYELEIALSRVPRHGTSERAVAPWLVDRLFRNLLADVSGNTHRTEICIDKLWDPGGAAGRQGLVELRAFEMPPHERMAVAQMLLVRAIVAMLAAQPYERPLIRWGSELHDRFMLPHFLWSDLEDVLGDLGRAGTELDAAWYRPFVELRCPVLGTIDEEGLRFELRAAIEPWPVLGEEAARGGTARHVDSSLERVEVKVDGLTEGRHLVMVNGLALPMRATGRAAERVGGVRYRAWQPPSSLQPTIGIHHPLRFDVIDTWARRSIAACSYHVWHPEGRAYTEPPLTLEEAAARRASRFTRIGHAKWPVTPIETRPHPEQPFTLDLRRYPVDRRIPGA